MSMMEAIQSVLSKYADFNGRARRSEYWYWTLAVAIVEVVVYILSKASQTTGMILFTLLFLAIIIPSIAVAVRRLHDTGKSGWWYLLNIIPFGGIVLLIFYVLDSTPTENQYGSSPKLAIA